MAIAGDCQNIESVGTEDLPTQLCGLLTEQVVLVRQGNLGQVERLGTRVDRVIAAMTSAPANLPLMAGPQRRHLQKLHDELVLALQAEQADVQTELKQLRQVKRVVGAYNRKKQRR